VLLFLTDGKPNEPWGREQYADVKRQAADSTLTLTLALALALALALTLTLTLTLTRPPSSTCT